MRTCMGEYVTLQMALRQGGVRTQLAAETLLTIVTLHVQLVGVAVSVQLTTLLAQYRLLRRV